MGILASLGQRTISDLEAFGDFCRFSGRTLGWVLEGATRWRNLRLLFPQLYHVGTRSIPVVMVTGAFVGMVLAVQMVAQFKAVGMVARMGTIVNLSVLRELGPVLAGVLLAGRVGGGLAAELGTMRVTEQIDALRAMGADPIRVLVVPRFLACVLLIPVLVMYADFMGIMGAYAVSVTVYGLSGQDFWSQTARTIEYFDIFYGPAKSVSFGMAISLISCFKGFNCSAGAAGVGRACTESFVASTMAVLALDFFLGMFMNTAYEFLYGLKSLL
jgi:phospholipid/cholesterol/gamma-HCH transport system permease protein